MRQRNTVFLASALIAGMIGLSLVFYDQLPAELVTHWNASGAADDTVRKPVAVSLLPGLAVLVTAMYLIIPRIDPKKEDYEKFSDRYRLLMPAAVGFLAYIHTLLLLWHLDFQFTMFRALTPAIAALLYVLGDVVGDAKQNWFIGIRTPWTLSDETVWNQTHERGETLFKALAAATLIGLVLPQYGAYIPGGGAALIAAYLALYSYVLYRNRR